MYDPPLLEALMITASFFAIFIIIVVSVLILEGKGTKPLTMTESGGRLPVLVGRCADSPVYS